MLLTRNLYLFLIILSGYNVSFAATSQRSVSLDPQQSNQAAFVTLDGRLQFSGGNGIDVRVVQPGEVDQLSNGFPVFSSNTFSTPFLVQPARTIPAGITDPDDERLQAFWSVNSISACSSDWQDTPYNCDIDNKPDPDGVYQCYDLSLFYTEVCTNSTSIDLCKNDTLIIKQSRALIRTAKTSMMLDKVVGVTLGPAEQPLRSVNDNDLIGIEVSLTKDGKLLTYGLPREVMYSILPDSANACSLEGWSEKKSIAEMHKDPIAKSRYPLAQRPLTDPAGVPLNYVRGAYPWIFPEGDNILFNARNQDCLNVPFRSQISVVGASTNWTTQLVEGGMNPTRGIRDYGNNNLCQQTLFSIAPELFSTQNIPGIQGQEVWPMYHNPSGYTEMALDDSFDEGIVAAWHMHEFVLKGENIFVSNESENIPGDFYITPDASGNYHSAEFNAGATIPDVNLGPVGRVVSLTGDDAKIYVQHDKLYGDDELLFVREDPDQNEYKKLLLRKNVGLPELNGSDYIGVELLFNMTKVANKDINLFYVSDTPLCKAIEIKLTQTGQVFASVCKNNYEQTKLQTTENQIITPLTNLLGQWHHLFVKYNNKNDKLSLYLNGVLIAEEQGPGNDVIRNTLHKKVQFAGDGFKGLIDEMVIYRRDVLEREICHKAGRRDCDSPLPRSDLEFENTNKMLTFRASYPADAEEIMQVELNSLQLRLNGLDLTNTILSDPANYTLSSINNGRGIQLVFEMGPAMNAISFSLAQARYFSIELLDQFGNKLFQSIDLTKEHIPSITMENNFQDPVKLVKNIPACDSDYFIEGENIFHDETFDGNSVTCSTCHKPEDHFALTIQGARSDLTNSKIDPELYQAVKGFQNGVDIAFECALVPTTIKLPDNIDLKFSVNVREITVYRAVPSIINSADTAVYNQDGRFSTLQEQAQGAVDAHFEPARTPEPIELDQLSLFQGCQIKPLDAIENPTNERGHKLFFGKARCAECHGGKQLALHDDAPASTFRKIAPDNTDCAALLPYYDFVIKPISGDASDAIEMKSRDPGRALITGNIADWEKFDTQGLQNIKDTAPYFHNNSMQTLHEVIDRYNTVLDLDLNEDEKNHLKNFLDEL